MLFIGSPESRAAWRKLATRRRRDRVTACFTAIVGCLLATPAFASNPEPLITALWYASLGFSAICIPIAYIATSKIGRSTVRCGIIALVCSILIAPVNHSGGYFPMWMGIGYFRLNEFLLPAAFLVIVWILFMLIVRGVTRL